MNTATGRKEDKGQLPAWTLLIGLVAQLGAVSLLIACEYRAISWGIGATVAVALVVAASYFDRFIDRKYLPNQRRK
ncbi:hypothetical protein [Ralstonia pseudosolanacearum]|uniref:hypothetical protein n=1 Tax=Ralstonia pseudosolanacearum TaxID=1310165 RepID=UPI003CF6B309